MKRHQMAPATSLSRTKEGGAPAGVAGKTLTVFNKGDAGSLLQAKRR